MSPQELIAKYSIETQLPDLLVGISDIDWSGVSHAHGQASDIPILLIASLSKIDYDREFAFTLLHETIWHQGTVYEASSYAIPFLIKMLKAESVPDKIAVAQLLASLISGHSCSKNTNYPELIRNAVDKDVHLLLSYLRTEIVCCVSEALVYYPQYANSILLELYKAHEFAEDLWQRECIEDAVSTLVKHQKASGQ